LSENGDYFQLVTKDLNFAKDVVKQVNRLSLGFGTTFISQQLRKQLVEKSVMFADFSNEYEIEILTSLDGAPELIYKRLVIVPFIYQYEKPLVYMNLCLSQSSDACSFIQFERKIFHTSIMDTFEQESAKTFLDPYNSLRKDGELKTVSIFLYNETVFMVIFNGMIASPRMNMKLVRYDHLHKVHDFSSGEVKDFIKIIEATAPKKETVDHIHDLYNQNKIDEIVKNKHIYGIF
jgi:hypothetical protein